MRLFAFDLDEAMSRPFELRVQLISNKSTLDTGKMIGAALAIKLTLPGGTVRHLNGRIASAGLVGSHRTHGFRYNALVRPALWFLTHTRRSRVFENLDAVAIVKDVLKAGEPLGLSLDVHAKTCATRPYCVQYQESDFDFVSRLLEEEGIYYFFRHTSNAHPMVLADGPGGHHEPLLTSAKMKYVPGASQGAIDEDNVLSWQCRDEVGPAKFALRDFDFERSTTKLDAGAQAKTAHGPSSLEVEVFPEGYLFDGGKKDADKAKATEQGKRFADVMAEQRDASARNVEGETDAPAMACGHTFEVDGLTVKQQDGKYLVVRTEIEFRQGLGGRDEEGDNFYGCRFSALRSEVPFRPAARTSRPRMYGPQTAIVVGSGEIDPDPYGRVRVRFHWGPSAKQTSCWVRVSHPWAGKGFGVVALPRVGEEVVVDFLDGDPDRPLITGRVYNAQTMPPYELPAQKTVSGIRTHSTEGGGASNFNELRFDDKKGSEYVWLQAEKIFHRLVKNDAFDVVGQDEHVKIARDRIEDIGRDWQVKVGQHLLQQVVGDAQVDIGKDTIASIGTNLGANVGQKLDVKAGQSIVAEAGTTIDLKAGMKIVGEGGMMISLKAGVMVVIDGGTQITLKAGPSTITLGPMGVTIDGPLVKINSGGGGGNANSAKAAAKANPKKPAKPAEQKDPIGKK
jgi:type VI secretion system secreted protein VgrG